MDNRKYLPIIVIGAIIVIVLLGLSSSIFFTIQANERAVLFKKFSGGLDQRKRN